MLDLIDRDLLDKCLVQVARSIPKEPQNPYHLEFAAYARSWHREREVLLSELQNGSYRIHPNVGKIVKKIKVVDGERLVKYRPVTSPHFRNRLVQLALLDICWPILGPYIRTQYSFGHRKISKEPSCGIYDAARLIKEHRRSGGWILETDLTQFFPTIDRTKLKSKLYQTLDNDRISDLLISQAETSIANLWTLTEEYGETIESNWWDPHKGVPQGSIVAPILANLYLVDFDLALYGSGFKALRYVDDIVILCWSEAEAQQAFKKILELSEEFSLTIPALEEKTKSKIVSPNDTLEFLGLVFTTSGKAYPLQTSVDRLNQFIEDLTSSKRINSVATLQQSYNYKIKGWYQAYRRSNIDLKFCRSIDDKHFQAIRGWFDSRGLKLCAKEIANSASRMALGFQTLEAHVRRQVAPPRRSGGRSLPTAALIRSNQD